MSKRASGTDGAFGNVFLFIKVGRHGIDNKGADVPS